MTCLTETSDFEFSNEDVGFQGEKTLVKRITFRLTWLPRIPVPIKWFESDVAFSFVLDELKFLIEIKSTHV